MLIRSIRAAGSFVLCVKYNIHIIRFAVAAKANRSYAVGQRPLHTSEEGSVDIAFVGVVAATMSVDRNGKNRGYHDVSDNRCFHYVH